MIRIALTKGRLEKQTIKLLEELGYGVEVFETKGRQLILKDSKKDIEYFLAKAHDCITYVEHGIADVAVVGKDTLLESNEDFYEMADLQIGKCQFIVASLPHVDIFKKIGHIKIGTKYPKITKKYFNNLGIDVEIIKIEGSVELGPIVGLCDGIVDIMETGNTLKENGLVVVRTVSEISARLIVNKASFRIKRKEISTLIDELKKLTGESYD